MPRNQDKACLHFELDPRGCGLCTEPQPQHQHQPQPRPDSRGRREEGEHSRKKHTRHHSGLRSESPPIAIRARTRPPPVERHTAKHRAPSKTRARSPVVPVVYVQQEEVPITHGRRSNRVRRRETAPAHHLEEAAAPRRQNSLRRDEDPIAPGVHALPYNVQFEGWVPDGQRRMNSFTEQVPAPSPPKHIWTSERNDNPAAPLNWVPLSVEIPPPPPPRRRYTSDYARHADPSPPEGWYVDGAAPEPSVRDTRHNHPHRNRNFSSVETERPAARESRRRDHNQPSIDSSARKDAHRKRGHAQDRDEQRTHYSVRVEYVYSTPKGSPGGWYQHEEVTHANTTHYHTTYETHYPADPYSSGTTYNNEPQSFHTYTEGESYERSSYPHPSTSHRDHRGHHREHHREHHRSGGKHRHDYPPHDAAEAVPPVKDLSEHWTVLGLQEGADDAAIRSAYKKMALKCHPDRQVGKDEGERKRMEELFLKVKAAHDTLLKK